MSSDAEETRSLPLEQDYPPLDAVNSRWWYWIAAYLVATVVFIPLLVIAMLSFMVPVMVVGPGQGPGMSMPIRLFMLLFMLLVFGVLVLSFVVFVMLPVALYMDARQVSRAEIDWEPDPVLYGVLGLLQFIVTPIVGIVVALYYLYKRHEEVGVP